MTKSVLLPMAFLAGLAGCSDVVHEPESGIAPPALTIHAVAAVIRQRPSMYEVTGTVRARSAAVISAKWMGYVREVRVQLGQRVQEGQSLVVLDARDLDELSNRATAARDEVRQGIPEAESAVASAKANLDLTQATFRRMSELYEKRSISDQEFDEISARLKAAEAAWEMALARRAQLSSKLTQAEHELRSAQVTRTYAEIVAPVSGIITVKSVDPGNLAVPGGPLLTIEREAYRLEAQVEESKLASIRVGHAASVKLDGIAEVFESRISEIVPTIDAAAHAYTAKIDLPAAASVRSGMFGRAVFRLAGRDVLEIPAAAVIERGQLESVFVAEGGAARTRLITAGARTGDQVEVLSGLNAGEQVIVPVPGGLSDGRLVEVVP
jgi:RND family efflux transporter MFP subunit